MKPATDRQTRSRPPEPSEQAASEQAPSSFDMDPEQFKRLGHRLVDLIGDFYASIPSRPVAPDVSPAEVREVLAGGSLNDQPQSAEQLLERATDLLFRLGRIDGHPRSWGYVSPSAAPIAALADFLSSAVNPNVIAWNASPIAAEIELQTVRWVAELIGYPTDTGGLLVSGGNMANFVGFLAARRAKANTDIRTAGVGTTSQKLRVYCSSETHTWVEKAADMFGLGTDAIRWIDSDWLGRIQLDALIKQIQADLAADAEPFLLIGTAGTTSTGAIDALDTLAAIAKQFGMWFHIDGAYGAPAAASPIAPQELRALRHADSLAVDAHKWLCVPLEAGIALVRDRELLRDTFSYAPPYYVHYEHPGEQPVDFHEYGPQNSRAFRALKVWLTLQNAGREGLSKHITGNLVFAKELFQLLQEDTRFEAFSKSLSIVTFRYVPADLVKSTSRHAEYLDRLNKALLERIQRSGELYLSNAIVKGRFALRAAIINFRTKFEDITQAPAIIARLGEDVDRELRLGSLRSAA